MRFIIPYYSIKFFTFFQRYIEFIYLLQYNSSKAGDVKEYAPHCSLAIFTTLSGKNATRQTKKDCNIGKSNGKTKNSFSKRQNL